jgi:hypothetical protein
MQVHVRRISIPIDDWTPAPPRVLFVSTSLDLRAAATRVLTDAGCAAVSASHAGHALLACMREPVFDVAVVDERERPMSPSLVHALRRLCPEMRLVRIGPADHAALHWPFTADHLVAEVRVALGFSRPFERSR